MPLLICRPFVSKEYESWLSEQCLAQGLVQNRYSIHFCQINKIVDAPLITD